MSCPVAVNERQSSCGRAARIDLLGIPVDPLTPQNLLEKVSYAAEASDRARLLFCLNVNYVNLAQGDPQLLQCFQGADTVYADGMGILWGAWILGQRLPAKITMTDFIESLCAKAAQRGYGIFFLGGEPGRAEEAGHRLAVRYPGLRIVGTHHGFFAPQDEPRLADSIRQAAPQILLVGLGAPRQEHWLTRNQAVLPPCAGLTCGALFDFVSGHLSRGPRWLTDHGLEWAWRLLIEPRRLWRRYLVGNPAFLLRVFRSRGERQRGVTHG